MPSDRQMIECPEPGVYHDVPAETYHRWDAANKSTLWRMLEKSPAHAKWERDHPREPTPAMRTGAALHAKLLEPGTFNDLYDCAPICDRRSKVGKATYAAFLDRSVGKEALAMSDWSAIGFMAKSVLDHDVAGAMLKSGGETEVCVVWDDEDTGVRCKARIDWLSEFGCVLADLKSTADASHHAFRGATARFGYHMQGAFYQDGANAAFGGGFEDYFSEQFQRILTRFHFFIVESSAPFVSAARLLEPDAAQAGRTLYKQMLEQYAKCQETGVWPGHPGLEDADIPAWAMPKE